MMQGKRLPAGSAGAAAERGCIMQLATLDTCSRSLMSLNKVVRATACVLQPEVGYASYNLQAGMLLRHCQLQPEVPSLGSRYNISLELLCMHSNFAPSTYDVAILRCLRAESGMSVRSGSRLDSRVNY
jgi:hypothetical protein